MAYNMTFVEGATGYLDLITGVNDLTSGLLMLLFMVIFYVILVAATRGQADNVGVMVAVSFIMSVVSALLWGAGLIGWRPLIIPSVVFLIMIGIYLFWDTGA